MRIDGIDEEEVDAIVEGMGIVLAGRWLSDVLPATTSVLCVAAKALGLTCQDLIDAVGEVYETMEDDDGV